MARSRIAPTPALIALVLVLPLVLASCGSAPPTRAAVRAPTAGRAAAAPVPVVRVVAAGDIACPPGAAVTPTQCQQGATAALARRLQPELVLPLGDTQYQSSSLLEYQGSYAKSSGALLGRTRPTVGNHEYVTPGARGYYDYFRN